MDVPCFRILSRPFLLNQVMETAPVPSSASQVQTWIPVLKLLLQLMPVILATTTELRPSFSSEILHISLLSAYLRGKNHKASLTVNMPRFSKSPALAGPIPLIFITGSKISAATDYSVMSFSARVIIHYFLWIDSKHRVRSFQISLVNRSFFFHFLRIFCHGHFFKYRIHSCSKG